MSTAVAGKGLEGIVATNSGICWIDGEAGVLSYRGIDIHLLAEHSCFEETTYLLWNGILPNELELRTRPVPLPVAGDAAAVSIAAPVLRSSLDDSPRPDRIPMRYLKAALALSFSRLTGLYDLQSPGALVDTEDDARRHGFCADEFQ